MLYFNRNGVWFTIPIAKDAVYSRELLEKQIHNSLLGLQKLKDRSPDLDQMRFEKPGQYVIKSVFGRDDILIFPPTIVKGGKISKPLFTFYEYPVPVYELVSGTYGNYYLNRFWVGLNDHWNNPTLDQEVDPITLNRSGAEFVETSYEDMTVYPLKQVGTNANYWSVEDYDNPYSEDISDWSPGEHGLVVADFLVGGPWTGTIDPMIWTDGGGYTIKECDVDGAIIRSNDIAQAVNLYGTTSAYHYWYEITYGFNTEYMDYYLPGQCPFVNHVDSTVVDVDEFTSPTQTKHTITTDTENNLISINGISVKSSSLISYKEIQYLWPYTEAAYCNVTASVLGDYAWVIGDTATSGAEDWVDFEAWCVVMMVLEYNGSNYCTHHPCGSAACDPLAGSQVTSKVIAKIAGSDTEFILYEDVSSSDTGWEADASCWNCEIYDFHGNPVYIIGLHIWAQSDVGEYNRYAMIYGEELFLSNLFDVRPSPQQYSSYVYDSEGRWDLSTIEWCRAVGVRQSVKITDIETEQV